jgi:hypothetical protein
MLSFEDGRRALVQRQPRLPAIALSPTLWRDALRTWEVALTAPWIIAMRCAQMVAAGAAPTRRDRAEFDRMGVEKVQAFVQGWTAVATDGWVYPLKLATALASAFPGARFAWPAFDPYARILAPVHRRVRANGKRLARVRGASRSH